MKIIFVLSLLALLYHYVLYAMFLRILAPGKTILLFRGVDGDDLPSVSLLIVAHNAESSVCDKIRNSLALEYPEGKLEIVFVSDGSDDATVSRAEDLAGAEGLPRPVRVLALSEFVGKNAAINEAVPQCGGEIVAFSDVDCLLADRAILHLVRGFEDPDVGGVCGRKRIARDSDPFSVGQGDYQSYEHRMQDDESALGSTVANEGTLYAMRRELFTPFPKGVTDDFFNALNVVRHGFRFVCQPKAAAFTSRLSKNTKHELERRRRIVNQSLMTLWSHRALLNPTQHGLYSWFLFSHKFLRRMTPLFLIAMFATSLWLGREDGAYALLAGAQVLLYGLAGAQQWLLDRSMAPGGRAGRAMAAWHYFCVGNLGSLIGIIDRLRGIRVEKWTSKD